jgi:hypothetical protein
VPLLDVEKGEDGEDAEDEHDDDEGRVPRVGAATGGDGDEDEDRGGEAEEGAEPVDLPQLAPDVAVDDWQTKEIPERRKGEGAAHGRDPE